MPAKVSVWLNNVKGLFPQPGTTGEQNEANSVTMGKQRPFHLSIARSVVGAAAHFL